MMRFTGGSLCTLCVLYIILPTCTGTFCTYQGGTMEVSLKNPEYPGTGNSFSCVCQVTNNAASWTNIAIDIHAESSLDNPECAHLLTIEKPVTIAVCPTKMSNVSRHKMMMHLERGQSFDIRSHSNNLDTTWTLQVSLKASGASVDVTCGTSANTTGLPRCPCGHGAAWGPGASGGTANDDGLGTRLGIGFGLVAALLVVIAIVGGVLYLKKRREESSSGEEDAPKERKEPIHSVSDNVQQQPPPYTNVPQGGVVYAQVGEPPINTKPAYPPRKSAPNGRSDDSGLQSMHAGSADRLDHPYSQQQQPGYTGPAGPNQVYNPAFRNSEPDVNALYAKPNKGAPDGQLPVSMNPGFHPLAGCGATGSHEQIHYTPQTTPHNLTGEENEIYVTDTSGSHNTSQNYSQTMV